MVGWDGEGVTVRTTVYVDVLLVINYIINLLLILCMAKISGVSPKRRKIVAAALVGALCSLTIFLPFMGFLGELAGKLLVSAAIVRIAMPYHDIWGFLRQWFVFFAVSFFFAGVMLALWVTFAPRWMVYSNGVVYFDISSLALIIATIIAYLLLSVAGKLSRRGRMEGTLCGMQIFMGEQICALTGLMDTGNSLFEPFSGAPVIVCHVEAVATLFPGEVVEAIRAGRTEDLVNMGVPFRLVPYSGVGGKGVLPAFAPDRLIIRDGEGSHYIGHTYIALTAQKIGDSSYSAILNPELIRINTVNGGAKK